VRRFLFSLLGTTLVFADPLTYDTNPLGTIDKPLILRTYMPDPGLDPAVFANHGKASKSPKYNPSKGQDVSGEYGMIQVVPAAIGVNHGPALSYIFDTTECRILYAWQGGFLDLFPHWGDEQKGGRRSFDYGARLVGNLFYLAQPESRPKPIFLGYKLSKNGTPTFRFKLGDQEFSQTVKPTNEEFSFELTTVSKNSKEEGSLKTEIIRGKLLSKHQGFERDLKIKTASIDAGEKVFGAYGCIACHSTDGSKGHGPSLKGLFGTQRPLIDGSDILADATYVRESIMSPNAKTAQGFPPNYMPPYDLKKEEVDSLVLYIESLSSSNPE